MGCAFRDRFIFPSTYIFQRPSYLGKLAGADVVHLRELENVALLEMWNMKKRGAEATSNSLRTSLEFDLRVGITDGSQGSNNRRKPSGRQEKSNVYGHIGQEGGKEGGA